MPSSGDSFPCGAESTTWNQLTALLMEYLQDFSAGLTLSTINVYVTAISISHIPIDSASLGRHPLVSRFLLGARHLRLRFPSWDLAVLLEGLSMVTSEPLESASEKVLILKVVLLLAITLLKRVRDLQALSVASSCLEFDPGGVKAILHPRPDYVPKVPSSVPCSVDHQAFCSLAFQSVEQERLNILCPIRALSIYVHRSGQWCKSELFVYFGACSRGSAASKQCVAPWIAQAISQAFGMHRLPSHLGIRACSTQCGLFKAVTVGCCNPSSLSRE